MRRGCGAETASRQLLFRAAREIPGRSSQGRWLRDPQFRDVLGLAGAALK